MPQLQVGTREQRGPHSELVDPALDPPNVAQLGSERLERAAFGNAGRVATARDAGRVGGGNGRAGVLVLAGAAILTTVGCGAARDATPARPVSLSVEVAPTSAPAADTGHDECAQTTAPGSGAGGGTGMAGDSSGLGWLHELAGITVVVEGDAESFAGPTTEVVNGHAQMSSWADDDSEWETPLGLPLMMVSDVEIVAETADDEIGRTRIEALRDQLADDPSMALVFTSAIYEPGQRYRLFLGQFGLDDQGRQAFSALYGWNVRTDRPAAGLDSGGWEHGVQELRCAGLVTGPTADVLIEVAAAMYPDVPSSRHEQIRSVLGVSSAPAPMPYELVPDGYWPVMADERVPGVVYAEVEVVVLGGVVDGQAYGLRGDKVLGWGIASTGSASVSGWIPPGETVELVTTDPSAGTSDVLPVESGGTAIQLTATPAGLFAFVDLRTGPPAISTYASRSALYGHVGAELAPPASTSP